MARASCARWTSRRCRATTTGSASPKPACGTSSSTPTRRRSAAAVRATWAPPRRCRCGRTAASCRSRSPCRRSARCGSLLLEERDDPGRARFLLRGAQLELLDGLSHHARAPLERVDLRLEERDDLVLAVRVAQADEREREVRAIRSRHLLRDLVEVRLDERVRRLAVLRLLELVGDRDLHRLREDLRVGERGHPAEHAGALLTIRSLLRLGVELVEQLLIAKPRGGVERGAAELGLDRLVVVAPLPGQLGRLLDQLRIAAEVCDEREQGGAELLRVVVLARAADPADLVRARRVLLVDQALVVLAEVGGDHVVDPREDADAGVDDVAVLVLRQILDELERDARLDIAADDARLDIADHAEPVGL